MALCYCGDGLDGLLYKISRMGALSILAQSYGSHAGWQNLSESQVQTKRTISPQTLDSTEHVLLQVCLTIRGYSHFRGLSVNHDYLDPGYSGCLGQQHNLQGMQNRILDYTYTLLHVLDLYLFFNKTFERSVHCPIAVTKCNFPHPS